MLFALYDKKIKTPLTHEHQGAHVWVLCSLIILKISYSNDACELKLIRKIENVISMKHWYLFILTILNFSNIDLMLTSCSKHIGNYIVFTINDEISLWAKHHVMCKCVYK